MKELLKELCLADSVSGDESAVRELIISRIKFNIYFLECRCKNRNGFLFFKVFLENHAYSS